MQAAEARFCTAARSQLSTLNSQLGSHRGQSLILVILVLIAIAAAAALFVALIAAAQARTGRQANIIALDNIAEAGIRYADYQLTYSAEGADWRPIPAGLFNPFPYQFGNGYYRLTLTYDPQEGEPLSRFIRIECVAQLARNPLLRRTKVAYKPILLTDYLRFVGNRDRSSLSAVLGLAEIPQGDDILAFATLWGAAAGVGTAAFTNGSAAVSGTGTIWTEELQAGYLIKLNADGVWYEIEDVEDDDTLTLVQAYSGTTGTGLYSISNNYCPLRINSEVDWVGTLNLMLADGERMEILGQRYGSIPWQPWPETTGTAAFTNGSTLVTGSGTSWVSAGVVAGDWIQLDSDGVWYEIQSVEDNTTIILSDAFSGLTGSGAYTIRKLYALNTRYQEPPAINTTNPTSGQSRYLLLTRDSGQWLQDGGGDWYNAGWHGYGAGIYVDNFYDVQYDHDLTALRNEWMTITPGLKNWNTPGWTYTPPGVTIVLRGQYAASGSGTATFTNGSDAVAGSGTSWLTEISPGYRIKLDAGGPWCEVEEVTDNTNLTLTAAYAGGGGSGAYTISADPYCYPYPVIELIADTRADTPWLRDRNGSGANEYWLNADYTDYIGATDINGILVLPYPQDGVIFAEGNVRIMGIMPPATSTGLERYFDDNGTPANYADDLRYYDLTVVSDGTIYIEGDLLTPWTYQFNGGFWPVPLTDGSSDARNSRLALLARDHVCLNMTALGAQVDVSASETSGAAWTAPTSTVPGYWTLQTGTADRLYFSYRTFQPYAAAADSLLYLWHGGVQVAPPPPPDRTDIRISDGGTIYFNWNTEAVPQYALQFRAVGGGINLYQARRFNTLAAGQDWAVSVRQFVNMPPAGSGARKSYWIEIAAGNDNYRLAGIQILPDIINIDALIYAQEGSWFILPGPWFNDKWPYTGSNIPNVVGDPPDPVNGAVPSYRRPFCSIPMDAAAGYADYRPQILINGAISESHTASLGDAGEWLAKWAGWKPIVTGGVPDTDPETGVSLSPSDPRLSYFFDAGLSAPAYRDGYGNNLPRLPRLPCPPGLIVWEER
jgi:hypothetical protein